MFHWVISKLLIMKQIFINLYMLQIYKICGKNKHYYSIIYQPPFLQFRIVSNCIFMLYNNPKTDIYHFFRTFQTVILYCD